MKEGWHWTDEEVRQLLIMFAMGLRKKEIAVILGRSFKSVKTRLEICR